MDKDFFNKRLSDIEQLFRSKKYAPSVRESGQTFEIALRELLQHLITDLDDANKRDEILVAEKQIAKGGESFRRFGLGQMVGLYNQAKIFEKLRAHLQLSLLKVRRINWNEVVTLRNHATHDDSGASIDDEDALQMYFWVKTFLYDTHLAGKIENDSKAHISHSVVLSACPECKHPLEKGWHFCPLCGTAVHAVCTSCGADLDPAFKICPYCEAPTRGVHVTTKTLHEYELLFRGAYLDMIITAQERAMLEQKRLELGISVQQAEEIEQRCIPKNILEYYHLVEGVLVDGIINDIERALLNKKIIELQIDPKVAVCIEDNVRRNYNID